MDLEGDMQLAEAFLTHIVTTVLANHRADLKVIGRDISKLEAVIAPAESESENSSVILSDPERAKRVEGESKGPETSQPTHSAQSLPATKVGGAGGASAARSAFPRLTYDEAHAMLERAFAEGKIEAAHIYGDDFGSPDETYISSQFDKPVMIHRYPAAIKAFYMQPDPIDPTKALCVDVLAPEGYGEIIGGSQRVDSYDLLKSRIEEHNLPLAAFEWYLDLRRYGSVPHSG